MEGHFSYESDGNVNVCIPGDLVKPKLDEWAGYTPDADIKDVRFLMSAKVAYEISGKLYTGMAFVDIANREAYHEDGKPHVASKQIFAKLDSNSRLPQDMFVADDEIRRQAAEAQDGISKN